MSNIGKDDHDKPKRYAVATAVLFVMCAISFLLAREIMKAHAHDDDPVDAGTPGSDAGVR